MNVLVMVKSTHQAEKGHSDSPEFRQMLKEMGAFNDKLRAAGILQMAEGLGPSKNGKRIAFDGDRRSIIDGPFPHPEELVAGFWIWKVKDMDEAVGWVKRCPNPMTGPSVIEIRPYDTLSG